MAANITNILDRFFIRGGWEDKVQDLHVSTGYNQVRGVITPVLATNASGAEMLDSSVIFQFNPDRVSYSKANVFGNHERQAHSNTIPFWQNGGARTIKFRLNMEGTAGANYRNMTSGASVTGDGNSNNGTYINYKDYNKFKDNQDGLTKQIEVLESLQYPMVNGRPTRFSHGIPAIYVNGNPVGNATQFENLPRIVFCYGNLYAEGYLTGLERTDTLYNKSLNPIRAEFDVTLTIDEARVVQTNIVLRPLNDALKTRSNNQSII